MGKVVQLCSINKERDLELEKVLKALQEFLIKKIAGNFLGTDATTR
ncbi:MAG: hypothetical protein JRJ00_13430 [Deltaproteobacteria bacterium]|nr:hypothetical protein [Deltaproteobacteria bacterium]